MSIRNPLLDKYSKKSKGDKRPTTSSLKSDNFKAPKLQLLGNLSTTASLHSPCLKSSSLLKQSPSLTLASRKSLTSNRINVKVQNPTLSSYTTDILDLSKKTPSSASLQSESTDNSCELAPEYYIPHVEGSIAMNNYFEPQPQNTVVYSEENVCKQDFINLAACSLIEQPKFDDRHNDTRIKVIELTKKMLGYDPEFILKLALFTRKQLNIRVTANFLVALAAFHKPCRVYIKKYYSDIVCLPSDWIDIAELYTSLGDQSINYSALPVCLRKAMAKKFPCFDEYQIGKYNKKPKKKKEVELTEEEKYYERHHFTLKQLIRKLHISESPNIVMPILGKKYPGTQEEFYRSKLPGHWDENEAGKRMKIPTPYTWETQLSANGNNSKTWKDLIMSRKLPYMAMLRNLRNIILSGVKDYVHKIVQKKLCSVEDVKRSKQFPFRFLSAYAVLDELETNKESIAWSTTPNFEQDNLISQYKSCLDKAVQISARNNVKPLRGSVLILFYCSSDMNSDCRSRGLGSVRTFREVAGLLTLMVMFSSEHCKLVYYNDNGVKPGKKLETGGEILKFLSSFVEESDAKNQEIDAFSMNLRTYFNRIIQKEIHFDNIIQINLKSAGNIHELLPSYREKVNPNVLYVNIDLNVAKAGILENYMQHRNDVYLGGFSDQMLQYISERGSGELLSTVESIDKRFKLRPLPRPMAEHYVSPLVGQVRSKILRLFVSSTFLDLEEERTVLMNKVIFHVNRLLREKHFVIQEIDLRWGVTAAEAKSNQVIERCLSEMVRCEYFLCIIGERYGTVIKNDAKLDCTREVEWSLAQFPDSSVTEIEVRTAIEMGQFLYNKMIFLIKKDANNAELPNKDRRTIALTEYIESTASSTDLITLDYFTESESAANFAKVAEKAIMASFNKRFEKGEDDDTTSDKLHHSFMVELGEDFVSRGNLLSSLVERLQKEQMVLVTGPEGTGKSCLLSRAIESVPEDSKKNSFYHFIKLDTDSKSLNNLLSRLCFHMSKINNEPLDDQFELISTLWGQLKKCETPFFLVIDGLDDLIQCPDLFSWLPNDFPSNIKVVFTAIQHGPWHTHLNKRYPKLSNFTVTKLSVAEKAEVAKKMLLEYGKHLENRGFNSEMSIFLSKRDATIPRFIEMSIEHLRLNAVFDNLSEVLQALPQTTEQLYTNALDFARSDCKQCDGLLQRLFCSRGGMMEPDILSFAQVKPVTLSRMLFTLRLFIDLDVKLGYVSIKNQFARKIIRQKCFDNYSAEFVHEDLALRYLEVINSDALAGPYRSTRRDAYQNVLYHYAQAGTWSEIVTLLTDMDFVRQCVYLRLIDDILSLINTDPMTLKPKDRVAFKQKIAGNLDIGELRQFLINNKTILDREPLLLEQQLRHIPDIYNPDTSFNENVGCFTSLNCKQTTFTCIVNHHFLTDVSCLDCSEDSKYVVVGFLDSKLQLFGVTTARLEMTYRGHTGPVTCCKFLTSVRFVSGGSDGSLRLWSTTDSVCITSITPHVHPVNDIDINSISKCIISAGMDRRVTVWHNDIIFDTVEFDNPMNCISFIEQGKKLVAGSWSGDVYVYDLVRKIKISVKKSGKAHRNSIRSLAAGRKQFVTLDVIGLLSLWDQASLNLLRSVNVGSVVTVALDPSDQLIFGYANGVVTIASGFGAVSSVTTASSAAVTSIMVTESDHFTYGDYGGDVRQGTSPAPLFCHKGRVNQIVPLGEEFAACSDDGTIYISDGAGWGGRTMPTSHVGKILSLAAIPEVLFSGGQDCTIIAHNMADMKEAKLHGHQAPVTVLLTVGGKLVSGSQDNSVRLWDLKTGSCLWIADNTHTDWVTCGAACPTLSKVFVTGSRDNLVIVWRVEGSKLVPEHKLLGLTTPVICVSLLRNSEGSDPDMVMALDQAGSVVLWNGDGKYISTVRPSESGCSSCAFAPLSYSNPVAFVGCNNGEVKKISISQLDTLATFTHHTSAVTALSPVTRNTFASISQDKTLQVWQWARTDCTAVFDSIQDMGVESQELVYIRYHVVDSGVYEIIILDKANTLSQYTFVNGDMKLRFKKEHTGIENATAIILPHEQNEHAELYESKSIEVTRVLASSTHLLEYVSDYKILLFNLAHGKIIDEKNPTVITAGAGRASCFSVTRAGIVMFSDIFSTVHSYNLKTSKRMPPTKFELKNKNTAWVSAVTYYNGKAIAGTTDGMIAMSAKEGRYKKVEHQVQFFSSAVTAIQCITDRNGNMVTFAGSRDGVVKVLTQSLKVIGVYYTNGAVAAIQVLQPKEHLPTGEVYLVVGDKCGKVHFLKWNPPKKCDDLLPEE